MNDIFSVDELLSFAERSYRALDVPESSAKLLADTLVQADLWGHQSHGVMRTFWYGDRFVTGAMARDAAPEWVVDAGGLAVLDGKDGIGQVVTKIAMEDAIRRAKEHGIGAVSVRNSGHFGTAMYFTRMAAAADCIGFLSTNASPAMAPWGGREKTVGNNPWSIAAPAGRHAPMVLDIANTAVARGKLYLARQRGEPIPETWAMDLEGNPTSDPVAGIAGTILPMAGHKGYAISAMMDVLSGVLSGSGFGPMVNGPYQAEARSNVGHLAMVIDIAKCRPLVDFNADMEHMIEGLKATPRADGVDEIYYPGELEIRADTEQRKSGVRLPQDTLVDLNTRAAALGVAPLG